MSSCSTELLHNRYSDGELPPEEAAQYQAHAAVCPVFNDRSRQYAALRAAFRQEAEATTLTDQELTASFARFQTRSRTPLPRVRTPRVRTRHRRRNAALAAAVPVLAAASALLAFTLLLHRPAPTAAPSPAVARPASPRALAPGDPLYGYHSTRRVNDPEAGRYTAAGVPPAPTDSLNLPPWYPPPLPPPGSEP